MTFKALATSLSSNVQIYGRIDADGEIRFSCVAEDPEFLAWLAEGNEPLPADEP